jgi:hypothetical protein
VTVPSSEEASPPPVSPPPKPAAPSAPPPDGEYAVRGIDYSKQRAPSPPLASPKSPAASPPPVAPPDDEYAVREPEAREHFETGFPATELPGGRDLSQTEYLNPHVLKDEEELVSSQRPELPPRPMVDGVLTIFTQTTVLICWGVLSIMVGVIAAMLYGAIVLGSVSQGLGIAAAFPWISSMILTGCLGIVFIVFLTVSNAYLLAILQDSAAGNERIENWPDTLFLTWATEVFFLVTSLLVPFAIAMALAAPLGGLLGGGWWLAGLCFWILFPIVLLSTLEMGSPLIPVSPMVIRSFGLCGRTWGVFYAQTGLLGLGMFSLTLGFLKIGFVGVIGFALLGIIATFTLILYYRLLGRLAWVCDERFRDLVDEDEEDEDDGDEEDEIDIRPPPVDDF